MLHDFTEVLRQTRVLNVETKYLTGSRTIKVEVFNERHVNKCRVFTGCDKYHETGQLNYVMRMSL